MSGEVRPAGVATGLALARDALRECRVETLEAGSPTKAAVYLCQQGGQRFVVKDARPQHALYRRLLGRRLLRREARALAALDGVDGVPRFLGRIDADAFAQELVVGVPLRGRLARHQAERFRAAVLDLERKVALLHARGVVHLDLRQRRNILVGEDGRVSLLDFESSVLLPDRGVRGLLLSLLRRIDRAACLKFKAKYAPDCMSEAERSRWRRQERLGRLWIFHRFGPLVRLVLGRKPAADEEDVEIAP